MNVYFIKLQILGDLHCSLIDFTLQIFKCVALPRKDYPLKIAETSVGKIELKIPHTIFLLMSSLPLKLQAITNLVSTVLNNCLT